MESREEGILFPMDLSDNLLCSMARPSGTCNDSVDRFTPHRSRRFGMREPQIYRRRRSMCTFLSSVTSKKERICLDIRLSGRRYRYKTCLGTDWRLFNSVRLVNLLEKIVVAIDLSPGAFVPCIEVALNSARGYSHFGGEGVAVDFSVLCACFSLIMCILLRVRRKCV